MISGRPIHHNRHSEIELGMSKHNWTRQDQIERPISGQQLSIAQNSFESFVTANQNRLVQFVQFTCPAGGFSYRISETSPGTLPIMGSAPYYSISAIGVATVLLLPLPALLTRDLLMYLFLIIAFRTRVDDGGRSG